MKKRLRKKTNRKEFKEFMWYVTYRLKDDTGEGHEKFWEPLIDQLKELDVMIGGTVDDFAATGSKRLSEEQAREKRDQLQKWLAARPEVAEANSSELTDAYYGPFRGQ